MKSNFTLLIMRLVFGGMMLFAHGLPKLTSYSQISPTFPDPLGVGSETSLILAIFAEFFCSLFVMLGLFTRWASIPVAFTMFIAGVIIHAGDPWAKKELALVYLFIFLLIALNGAGSYSLDQFRKGSKR